LVTVEEVYRLRRLFRPEYYQGPLHGGTHAYFEGWYYKVAFADSAIAVIPGVSYAQGDPHAFIQTISQSSSGYNRFPVEDFSFKRSQFAVDIAGNHFTLHRLAVDLPDLSADLRITPSVRWPSTLLSPSSMGWYSYMRFMECYHGIIIPDGLAHGAVNGQPRDNGRFYLEKDWGVSFPTGWVWMQSNSFEQSASITLSIAQVPFRRRVFTGFIAALWDGSTLHRFTTYTGASIEAVSVQDKAVTISLSSGSRRLSLVARRADGAELVSPTEGRMEGRITETLSAEVEVLLEDKSTVLFHATGRYAGLEVVNPNVLL